MLGIEADPFHVPSPCLGFSMHPSTPSRQAHCSSQELSKILSQPAELSLALALPPPPPNNSCLLFHSRLRWVLLRGGRLPPGLVNGWEGTSPLRLDCCSLPLHRSSRKPATENKPPPPPHVLQDAIPAGQSSPTVLLLPQPPPHPTLLLGAFAWRDSRLARLAAAAAAAAELSITGFPFSHLLNKGKRGHSGAGSTRSH